MKDSFHFQSSPLSKGSLSIGFCFLYCSIKYFTLTPVGFGSVNSKKKSIVPTSDPLNFLLHFIILASHYVLWLRGQLGTERNSSCLPLGSQWNNENWETRSLSSISKLAFFFLHVKVLKYKHIMAGSKAWTLVVTIWIRAVSWILACIFVQSFEKPCKHGTIWRRDSEL